MRTVELKHSVNRRIHTFVDGEVRLVASRLKGDQYGHVRAYLKAFVGGLARPRRKRTCPSAKRRRGAITEGQAHLLALGRCHRRACLVPIQRP
jgi:hypothetical protein